MTTLLNYIKIVLTDIKYQAIPTILITAEKSIHILTDLQIEFVYWVLV